MKQKIDFSNIKNTVSKIRKYGIFVPISNIFLNYFGRYIPDGLKSRMYPRRNRIIKSYLAPIVDRVNSEYEPLESHTYEQNIWVCWFQGEDAMPELTKICLSSIRKNANGRNVILLTADNYKRYVTIHPTIIKRYERGELKPAHFADIIRMNLLAQRGGLWLDATMLVTAPIPDYIFNYPFFSIKTANEGYFVSQCRWAVFMLACKPGNVILTKVAKAFELYLLQTEVFVDYFMFDHFINILYHSDASVREMIDSVPYNNPSVHRLGAILCHRLNEEEYHSLIQNTSFFKLNNRAYNRDELNHLPDSYYAYFKKLYIR